VFHSPPSTLLLLLFCSLLIVVERLEAPASTRGAFIPTSLRAPTYSHHRLQARVTNTVTTTFLRTLGRTHYDHQHGVRSSIRSSLSFHLHHATYWSPQLKLCGSMKVRNSFHRVTACHIFVIWTKTPSEPVGEAFNFVAMSIFLNTHNHKPLKNLGTRKKNSCGRLKKHNDEGRR